MYVSAVLLLVLFTATSVVPTLTPEQIEGLNKAKQLADTFAAVKSIDDFKELFAQHDIPWDEQLAEKARSASCDAPNSLRVSNDPKANFVEFLKMASSGSEPDGDAGCAPNPCTRTMTCEPGTPPECQSLEGTYNYQFICLYSGEPKSSYDPPTPAPSDGRGPPKEYYPPNDYYPPPPPPSTAPPPTTTVASSATIFSATMAIIMSSLIAFYL